MSLINLLKQKSYILRMCVCARVCMFLLNILILQYFQQVLPEFALKGQKQFCNVRLLIQCLSVRKCHKESKELFSLEVK